jgi:hypothetical protein
MAQADAPNIIEVFGGIADKTGWHLFLNKKS